MPALDDVGLVRALEQQAHRLTRPTMPIELRCDDLGELPAAVEVAVYRIASEAMTNAARHAAASSCEIADDGIGIAADRASGVGLLSVRERAAELGGRCEVLCPPGGGTAVRARLPLEVR
jgi:signal transduction histidine kinase